MARALQAETGLPAVLLGQAREDLVDRRLLRPEKRFLRTVLVRTPEGDAWCTGLAAQRERWRQALAAGGARADAALDELALAPGLVPLLDAAVLRDVDRAVRRRPDGGGDAGDGGISWSALGGDDGLDGLGGLDGAFDAVDSSGADSGGDSGGGDGGGGGD